MDSVWDLDLDDGELDKLDTQARAAEGRVGCLLVVHPLVSPGAAYQRRLKSQQA